MGQAAVWTGREMVVWGGDDQMTSAPVHTVDDGAAYDPATDRWRMLPPSPLSARADTVAVWTGRLVVLLGGRPAAVTAAAPGDGAAFDPVYDSWQHIAAPPHHRGTR